ncbi:hypothetical protein [Sediminicoccus rosea]|uniref:Uncharacterized protein n=1 Tax=Sediminicoccus rosea TaxID=1225128 RepID=A0ABZ0PDZ4_9PROT|nr:hypothetical protein [Sediminicoccus rosea]WPB83925.1 hypothetical protein R9Z33_17630 [Sediminicoccus rosea]
MPFPLPDPHSRRPVAAALCLALSLLRPEGAAAQSPPAASPAMLQIPLSQSPTAALAEPGGREIVLIFPGAVPRADAAALERAAASGLIEGLNIARGAARLRLARPAQPRLVPQGEGSLLVLQSVGRSMVSPQDPPVPVAAPEPAPPEPATPEPAPPAMDLPVLRESPREAPPITRFAAAEAPSPGARAEAEVYQRALAIEPGASPLVAARGFLTGGAADTLRSDGFWAAGPGGERIVSLQFAGSARLAEGWVADFRLEGRKGESRSLRQTGQDVAAPWSGEAMRGEFGIERQWDGMGRTRLAVLGSPRAVGVSARHSQRLGEADIAASGAWNQPYWETMMAFAGYAVRDHAVLDLGTVTGQGIGLRVGGGFVRYGLPTRADVAQGGTVNATLNWTAPEAWMPVEQWRARLGYHLFAEYLSGVAQAPTAQGPSMPLLDVRTREVHRLEGALSGPAGPAQVTLLGGYAWDRYGGSGPVALLRATNRDEARLSFGIEAGVGPSLAENARAVWRAGGFLVWR